MEVQYGKICGRVYYCTNTLVYPLRMHAMKMLLELNSNYCYYWIGVVHISFNTSREKKNKNSRISVYAETQQEHQQCRKRKQCGCCGLRHDCKVVIIHTFMCKKLEWFPSNKPFLRVDTANCYGVQLE